jgi:hypothetical protein
MKFNLGKKTIEIWFMRMKKGEEYLENSFDFHFAVYDKA